MKITSREDIHTALDRLHAMVRMLPSLRLRAGLMT
jgi:hypothetical protein